MGILCDVVAAPKSAAEQVGRASVPSEEFGGLDLKGLNDEHFVALSVVLGHASEDLPVAWEGGPDGPWVFGLPDEVARSLAALDDTSIEHVASAWHRWEGGIFDFHSTEDLREILAELANLARGASHDGRGLFVWLSL